MSKKETDRAAITSLFREEAGDTPGFPGNDAIPSRVLPFEAAGRKLPQLPEAFAAPEAEQRAYWRTLRAFYRSGKGGGLPAKGDKLPAYPALLAPFRDRGYVQGGFPCWAADAEAEGAPAGGLFYALPDLLEQAVRQFAPQEGQARILKDNLLRLEAIIRSKLAFADAAFKALPVFQEALEELEAQLSIKGEEGKAFSGDLLSLGRHLPQSGVLLPFSPDAPLHLLATVIQRELAASRQGIREEIAQLSNKLKDILAVEREKGPESHSPEQLHSALDFADAFLNFEELSAVLPSGGSEAMPEERHHRIEMVLDALNQADTLLFGQEAFVLLGGGRPAFREVDWKYSFPRFVLNRAASGSLSAAASRMFDQEMGKAARVFAALRIGRMEVANQYVPEMHSDFFAHFDWRSFNGREMAACAPVLLLSDVEELLEMELNDFSRLLASGRPVKFLIAKNRRPAAPEEDGQPAAGHAFRQELGALAVAHRNAFVMQSSALRPEYMHRGFARGISASAPALFYLLSPADEDGAIAEPSLWASAAVEGREFPAFIFDSMKGPKWGSRFDISENPQPEAGWPAHQLAIQDEKGKDALLELPFTFADFAVLDGRFNSYFHIVPPEYWAEGLMPLATYLEFPPEEVYARVPFIWLVDEAGLLQRAAVAWPLVLACRERLDFWFYLQENAGIHSYHVEQATERIRRELEQAAEEQVAALKEKHGAELEKVKEETARNAMERLASMLLDLDAAAMLPASREEAKAGEPAKPAPKAAATEAPPPVEPAAEEKLPPPEEENKEPEGALGEAWIETPLCTSCNECIDANKKIFQYNADKQAFVADPKGGPFSDIVKAAEKCPVKIIHPGAPQNPDEEGLEEWVKRAAAYNNTAI